MEQAEEEESFSAVWLALRRLPVRQSEVVVLKVWEGLTFAQIGEVLAVSPATATSRYRYALEKLSLLLAPQAPEAASVARRSPAESASDVSVARRSPAESASARHPEPRDV